MTGFWGMGVRDKQTTAGILGRKGWKVERARAVSESFALERRAQDDSEEQATAKCGGPSTTQWTMKPSAASVGMTECSVGMTECSVG